MMYYFNISLNLTKHGNPLHTNTSISTYWNFYITTAHPWELIKCIAFFILTFAKVSIQAFYLLIRWFNILHLYNHFHSAVGLDCYGGKKFYIHVRTCKENKKLINSNRIRKLQKQSSQTIGNQPLSQELNDNEVYFKVWINQFSVAFQLQVFVLLDANTNDSYHQKIQQNILYQVCHQKHNP